MDNEQRAALRKLAEEATPGPWYCKHHNEAWSAIVLEAGSYLGFIDAWSSPVVEGVQCSAEQLSNYIAAANPSTILQLLDYIETLEKADIAFLNQQLAEKDAEIERLSRLNSSYSILTEQLAASQAREQQLREAFQTYIDEHEECTDFDGFPAQIASMDDYHEFQGAIAKAKEVAS